MEEPPAPPGKPQTSQHMTYWSIISISALLCFAWLLTGSLILTLLIIVLGLLHLARHFPEAEQMVSADPLLLGLRRYSFVIIFAIAALLAFVRYMR